MGDFSDYAYALRFRNVIRKVVLDILEVERPIDKVGRVVDMDRSGGLAYVVYAGAEADAVKVKIYPGIQPQSTDKLQGAGAGSIVRVSGSDGARYISQVLSGSPHLVQSRLANPYFASGGSGDSTLRTMFSLSSNSVPVADSATSFPVAEVLFPKGAGAVNVYTEMLSNTASYFQRDTFTFDSTTVRGSVITASNTDASSVGMVLATRFNLYDGETIGGAAGTTGMDLSYLRGSGSTKTPDRMNVHVDCFGSDVRLNRLMEDVF